MIMRKTAVEYCAVILFVFQCNDIAARMQPIKLQGRYYYDKKDIEHQHISMRKAATFVVKHVFSPVVVLRKVTSLFYASSQKKIDAYAVLKPMQTKPEKSSIEPKITWVGHATFLVQTNGFNILTDPIFGHVKAGPFTLTKRTIKPGILLKHMPRIDAIVISHNHSDHMDTTALMALAKKYNPVIYAPKGNYRLLKSMGFSRVVTNTWWDTNMLEKDGRTVTITCLPARHWSIRFSLTSYRKSLWASWMIQAPATDDKINSIYFAGDTAAGPHFKEIAYEYPNIDVALMPISPSPKGESNVHVRAQNRHAYNHVDAKGAVDAFIQLGARCFVPMHYGTFFLSEETLTHPIAHTYAAWQAQQDLLGDKELLFAQCGKQYSIL